MCKICIARAWMSTFSRDAMQILCLSLAGRWWRAECETSQLVPQEDLDDSMIFASQKSSLNPRSPNP